MENSKLAEALSKAQGEITPPLKNRNVDFLDKNGRRVKYSYADLADVIESVKAPLFKNGLAVSHVLERNEELGFGMITMLLHCSGESIKTWYPLPNPFDLKPQEFGSAITYARRYSLSCLLGVTSEEDDDGAEAPAPKIPQGNPSPRLEPKTEPRPVIQPVAPKSTADGLLSEAQIKRLFAIASSRAWTHEQIKIYMFEAFGIESTKALKREQYELLVRIIETTEFGPAILDIQYAKDAVPQVPEIENQGDGLGGQ